MEAPIGWVVTDGSAGHLSQALGLAEALGMEPIAKTVRMRRPWRLLPPRLWLQPVGFGALAADALAPPWPDLAIGCGRPGAVAAHLIRRASAGRTFAVYIQRPPLPASGFDVVVVPRHDGFTAPNAVVTDVAVHRITRAKLAAAAERFAGRYGRLPSPRVAVLIGGSNRRYRLSEARARLLAEQLAALADSGAGLMVTTSRRTERHAARILADALAGRNADIWDGAGENPYLGMLALADAILVTRDSVSMTSEAVFTGKPVHVIALEGWSSRIERFHAHIERCGYTRPFAGRIERWSYTPPDDTAMAATRIRPLLEARLEGARVELLAPAGGT